MGKIKRKKTKRNRSQGTWHDLNVPLYHIRSSSLSSSSKEGYQEALKKKEHLKMIQRFENTGYSSIAFSHTIYGCKSIHSTNDLACTAIPLPNTSNKNYTNKKRKREENNPANHNKTNNNKDDDHDTQPNTKISILRRLNIVMEEVSDLQYFTSSFTDDNDEKDGDDFSRNKAKRNVFQSYDLVAISPQNDTVFAAACTSPHSIYGRDIILSLDYTCGRGGVQLPYKLKRSLIQSAVQNGIIFEFPYAPAIVDVSKRKALIQTIMTFHSTSIGLRPQLMLCSGSRHSSSSGGRDASTMALRTPGDLINLLHNILGFSSIEHAKKTLDSTPALILQNTKDFKCGKKQHLQQSKRKSNSNDIVVSVQLQESVTHFNDKKKETTIQTNDTSKNYDHDAKNDLNSSGYDNFSMDENDEDSETGEGFIRL